MKKLLRPLVDTWHTFYERSKMCNPLYPNHL
jgi:hypothetical protein